MVMGSSKINVTVDEVLTEIYYANYSGNFTVELFALSLPADASFDRVPDSDVNAYTLTWRPTSLTTEKLVYV